MLTCFFLIPEENELSVKENSKNSSCEKTLVRKKRS